MSCSIVVILVVLKDLSGRAQEFGLALWIVFLWGWGGYKGVWYIGYTRVVYHLYASFSAIIKVVKRPP